MIDEGEENTVDTGRFRLTRSPLKGVFVVERKPLGDARGFLERLFCVDELQVAGLSRPPVQINRTLTKKAGTLRGLHYQRRPHSEIKMISCLAGRIFDVAVDLRKESPTYGRWYGHELSQDNHVSMIIPEGCAHGFQTLSDLCELVYCHSERYAPAAEGGINFADTTLAIDWPLTPTEVSDRDRAMPVLDETFAGA